MHGLECREKEDAFNSVCGCALKRGRPGWDLSAKQTGIVARSYRRACDRIVIRIVEVAPAREARACGQEQLFRRDGVTINSRTVTDKPPASEREAALCQDIGHSVWRSSTVPLPASPSFICTIGRHLRRDLTRRARMSCPRRRTDAHSDVLLPGRSVICSAAPDRSRPLGMLVRRHRDSRHDDAVYRSGARAAGLRCNSRPPGGGLRGWRRDGGRARSLWRFSLARRAGGSAHAALRRHLAGPHHSDIACFLHDPSQGGRDRPRAPEKLDGTDRRRCRRGSRRGALCAGCIVQDRVRLDRSGDGGPFAARQSPPAARP